jgi:hypothetical protein
MKAAQLEREVLALPPAERAHLALAAWESLVADPAFAADRTLDPEGLKVAAARDKDIDSGKVKPISHDEFLRRTAKK